MRRQLWRVASYTLVVTLASPATVAFAAGPADDRSKPSPAIEATPVVPPATVVAITREGQPTSLGSRRAWQDEVRLATTQVVKQSGRVGVSKPVTSGVRHQGGGGKSGMITMLVSTVVGLAATVYMIRYMKDQQDDIEDSVPTRLRFGR